MPRKIAALVAAAVLVGLVASCKNKSTPSPAPSGGGGGGTQQTTITIPRSDIYGQSSFSPASVTVPVGRTVVWRNSDAGDHTTTSDTGLWNSSLAAGAEFTRTFSAVGTFNYKCTVHAGMTGTVTVQ